MNNKRIRGTKSVVIPLLILMLFFLLICPQAVAREWSWEEEKKFGKKIAEEIEKDLRILSDQKEEARLKDICKKIGAGTERPDIEWTVKVIDDTDINAFSLPGGFIYITNGLMNFIQSEHELAGVLSHEIAHIVHQDSLKKLEKDKRLTIETNLTAILAAIIGGNNVDTGALILAANAIKINALSGYGRKIEFRADKSAVSYLAKSEYNPVGILTFMERLLREEKRRPYLDLGIFKTHPDTEERVQNIIRYLIELKIPINRRAVTQAIKAKVRVREIDNQKVAEIILGDKTVFQLGAEAEGLTPYQRAEEYTNRLNQALDKGLKASDLHLNKGEHHICIVAGMKRIISFYPEDAEYHNTSLEDLAESALNIIRQELWEDFLRMVY